MRIVAAAILFFLAIAVWAPGGRADTLRFTAELGSDVQNPSAPAPARGHAAVSLDTAGKIATWTIEYSGEPGPPLEVGCGVMEPPGAPAIRQTANLTSPVSGTKTLTDAEIAALTAGQWACVITTDRDGVDIGGVLQPQH